MQSIQPNPEKQPDIRKAAGLIIRDRKVLVSRSKGKVHFVQPGGKLEGDESPELALVRELREEQQAEVDPSRFESLGTYRAIAAGFEAEQLIVELHAFLVDYDGPLTPSAEIDENRWIDTSDIGQLPLGSIMEHDILPLLKSRDLIN